MLILGERGVIPQAGCDLSVVFNCKQTKAALALLEHKVVCLSNLFGEGTEWEPDIGEDRFGEGGIGAMLLSILLRQHYFDVGADGRIPGGGVGRHDYQSFTA